MEFTQGAWFRGIISNLQWSFEKSIKFEKVLGSIPSTSTVLFIFFTFCFIQQPLQNFFTLLANDLKFTPVGNGSSVYMTDNCE